jgi:hypothetical protein
MNGGGSLIGFVGSIGSIRCACHLSSIAPRLPALFVVSTYESKKVHWVATMSG